jgi:hypothetical protein
VDDPAAHRCARGAHDGDRAAWAILAARQGFVDCAITDSALPDLIKHD